MENADNEHGEVDALCRECGYAFKLYVDRLFPEKNSTKEDVKAECPVCGCTDCKIGK